MTTKTLQMQVQDDRLERIAQTRKPILGTAQPPRRRFFQHSRTYR